MRKAGTNALDLVCGHGSAHTASADQDPAFRATRDNFCAKVRGTIGVVIRRLGVVRAEVDYLMIEAMKLGDDGIVQRSSGMIGGNGYSHIRSI